MIEVGRGQFSIEPFLFTEGKLVTWSDVKTSVASNPEALPLPQVVWSTNDLDLTISPFAAGPVDSSVLYARYRIANNSRAGRTARAMSCGRCKQCASSVCRATPGHCSYRRVARAPS